MGLLAGGRDETNNKYSSVGGLDVLACHIFACPQQKHNEFQCNANLSHVHVLYSQ